MVKVIECGKCSKQFNHKGKYKKHLMSHEQLKPFKCPECSVMLSAEWILKRHRETKHSGLKPYACFQCNVSFTSKDHLHRHLNTRKHVPFICEDCGKVFQRVNAFNSHKCKKNTLRDHKKDSQEAKTEKVFIENLGNEDLLSSKGENFEFSESESQKIANIKDVEIFFRDDEESLADLRRETSAESETLEKWKCFYSDCTKEYSTRSNLRTHIRTAHEKLGFTCEICKTIVMHNHTLQKHLVACRERYLKISIKQF